MNLPKKLLIAHQLFLNHENNTKIKKYYIYIYIYIYIYVKCYNDSTVKFIDDKVICKRSV